LTTETAANRSTVNGGPTLQGVGCQIAA
jgi:hypothetical protein